MKALLITLFILIAGNAFCQGIQCVAEPFFFTINMTGDLYKIEKPIAACFDGEYFSVSSDRTGTKTFKIEGIHRSTNKDGFVEEDFINEEDPTTPRGYYDIQVNYEKEKVIVINYTKSGIVYIIKSKAFIGSVAVEQGADDNLKKRVSSIKESKPPKQ